MKLPRFHLSTLMVVCIAAATIAGLCLTSRVWQRAETLQLDQRNAPVTLLEFDPRSERILAFNGRYLYLFDNATTQKLWKQPFYVADGLQLEARFIRRGGALELTLRNADKEIVKTYYYETARGLQAPLIYDDPRDKLSKHFANSDAFNGEDITEFAHGALYYNESHSEIHIDYAYESLEPRYYRHSFDTELKCYAIRYSPDGNLLAAGHVAQISLWRRTRAYGGFGIVRQPLYLLLIVLTAVIVLKARKMKPIE